MGNLSGKEDEDRGGSFEASPNRTNSSAPAGPLFHSTTASASGPVDMGAEYEHSSGAREDDSGGGKPGEDGGGDCVPTMFRWAHGGREVNIIGTFNGWKKQITMHRSGNDFTHIHDLPKGKHVYKFVVDDVWRFAPDQPTVTDAEGNINNFLDVSEFTPFIVTDDVPLYLGAPPQLPPAPEDEDVYGQFVPSVDDYQKDPPPLPAHLRHIVLNKPPSTVEPTLLPTPHHVLLNHLYCTAIKDGMMVLGITQRFRRKFVTTVFCSVEGTHTPPPPPQAAAMAVDLGRAEPSAGVQ
eukprot:g1532.t1